MLGLVSNSISGPRNAQPACGEQARLGLPSSAPTRTPTRCILELKHGGINGDGAVALEDGGDLVKGLLLDGHLVRLEVPGALGDFRLPHPYAQERSTERSILRED